MKKPKVNEKYYAVAYGDDIRGNRAGVLVIKITIAGVGDGIAMFLEDGRWYDLKKVKLAKTLRQAKGMARKMMDDFFDEMKE